MNTGDRDDKKLDRAARFFILSPQAATQQGLDMLPKNLFPRETPITLDEDRAEEFRRVELFVRKYQAPVIWGLVIFLVLTFIVSGASLGKALFLLIPIAIVRWWPIWWLENTRYCCPHTGKFLEPHERWKCPQCNRINGGEKSDTRYSYIMVCPTCKFLPDAFRTPWKNEIIYLTSRRKRELVAVKEGDKWIEENEEAAIEVKNLLSPRVTEEEKKKLANLMSNVSDDFDRDIKIRQWKQEVKTRLKKEKYTESNIKSAMQEADQIAIRYKKGGGSNNRGDSIGDSISDFFK